MITLGLVVLLLVILAASAIHQHQQHRRAVLAVKPQRIARGWQTPSGWRTPRVTALHRTEPTLAELAAPHQTGDMNTVVGYIYPVSLIFPQHPEITGFEVVNGKYRAIHALLRRHGGFTLASEVPGLVYVDFHTRDAADDDAKLLKLLPHLDVLLGTLDAEASPSPGGDVER